MATAFAADRTFHFPATGVRAGGRVLLLAIDDQSLSLRENLVEYLSKPSVRKEPVLSPDKDDFTAPDQVASHFYGAVLQDNGKFRMWYYAVGMKEPGDARHPDVKKLTQGPVCYAESNDGIHWIKPVLGQLEFHGSKKNNAIALPDALIEGVHVIKDADDPNPQRRYKMVYNPHNGTTWVIRTATSADGIHWQAAPTFGIDRFLETSSFYKFNGLFVTSGQRLLFSEGGHKGGRQSHTVVSPDFDHWLPGDVTSFALAEPQNPADRGQTQPYDQVHLGVGAASFGNVCVGLYGLWRNQPGDESDQKRWGWFGYGKISCDFGLVVSNDGLHFREPVKGHVYLSQHDAPATPVPGKNYPTILTQSGNGILNVGDETRIYFGRWLNAEYGKGYHGEVGLAVLPRDRWGALGLYPASANNGAGFGGKPRTSSGEIPDHGSVWSAPVRLPDQGCKVFLNADHAALMDVEIADERFNPLPGYSGAKAGRTSAADGLDCPVVWPADFAALAGNTIRFKINLHRGADGAEPRLFAVTLQAN
ncbi:MAG: hypothetical protein JSS11_08805 [Verrucomicrobia bacterium]|nr:hypothetical protein [Verrucomicrobiota bacterium]